MLPLPTPSFVFWHGQTEEAHVMYRCSTVAGHWCNLTVCINYTYIQCNLMILSYDWNMLELNDNVFICILLICMAHLFGSEIIDIWIIWIVPVCKPQVSTGCPGQIPWDPKWFGDGPRPQTWLGPLCGFGHLGIAGNFSCPSQEFPRAFVVSWEWSLTAPWNTFFDCKWCAKSVPNVWPLELRTWTDKWLINEIMKLAKGIEKMYAFTWIHPNNPQIHWTWARTEGGQCWRT